MDALSALGAGGVRVLARRAPETGIEPVSHSPEIERILALPRTDPVEEARLVEEAQALVTRPNAQKQLWPTQARFLAHVRRGRGGFGPIAVGGGKTLVLALAGTVLEAGPSVILTSAGLVRQARRLTAEYACDFYVRRDVRWVSYGVLSSPTQFEILERLAPAVIALDECQNVSNGDAARTKRLERYLERHPETIVVAASGTITRRSIEDYAKLVRFALKDRTPLPRDWKTTREWADALDVSDRPRPPGALSELVTDAQIDALVGYPHPQARERTRHYVRGAFRRPHRWESEESSLIQGMAREAVKRRLVESWGVVSSTKNDQSARLRIELVPAPESGEIEEARERAWDLWERPDGELMTLAIEMARVDRHLRLGGFYRWIWPKDLERKTIDRWLLARKEWRRELRDFLKHRSKEGLDSPFLVEQAVKRGELHFDSWGPWREERAAMKERLGQPLPDTEWIWISDAVVADAEQRVREMSPCVAWTEVGAVGRELAKRLGALWMGAGKAAQRAILDEDGSRTIAASIRAHGTGRNLQHFCRAFVVGLPSGGATLEQLFGRHHRPGQDAEEVLFRAHDSFRGELEAALRDAEYIEASTGNEQKLNHAELVGAERKRWRST